MKLKYQQLKHIIIAPIACKNKKIHEKRKKHSSHKWRAHTHTHTVHSYVPEFCIHWMQYWLLWGWGREGLGLGLEHKTFGRMIHSWHTAYSQLETETQGWNVKKKILNSAAISGARPPFSVDNAKTLLLELVIFQL